MLAYDSDIYKLKLAKVYRLFTTLSLSKKPSAVESLSKKEFATSNFPQKLELETGFALIRAHQSSIPVIEDC